MMTVLLEYIDFVLTFIYFSQILPMMLLVPIMLKIMLAKMVTVSDL